MWCWNKIWDGHMQGKHLSAILSPFPKLSFLLHYFPLVVIIRLFNEIVELRGMWNVVYN